MLAALAVVVPTSAFAGETLCVLARNGILRAAIHSSPAAQQAFLDHLDQQAQWQAAQAQFSPFPTLSSAAQRQWIRGIDTAADTATLAAGIDWTLPAGTRISASLSPTWARQGPDSAARRLNRILEITQPLWRGAGAAARLALEQARLAERIGGYQQGQVLDEVYVAVTGAWFDAVLARKQVGLAQQALARVSQVREVNQSLRQAGRLAQVELLQSDADVAQAELALEQAQNVALAAVSGLLQGLGPEFAACRPADVVLPEALPAREAQADAGAVDDAAALDAALAEALAQRADLQMARALVALARLGAAQVEDQGRAALDLAWRLQSSTSAGAASAAERAVSLTWQLPLDRSALRLAQTQAQLALRRAELALQDLERQVRRDVADARREAGFARRQWQLATRTVDLNRRKLDAETERFRAGKTSGFQLSAAQDALRDAESAQAQAALAAQRADLALERALGRIALRRQALGPAATPEAP